MVRPGIGNVLYECWMQRLERPLRPILRPSECENFLEAELLTKVALRDTPSRMTWQQQEAVDVGFTF